MPYGKLERRIARLLDSSPRLRAGAKAAYQRLNYALRGGPGQRLRMHPQATIERVAGGGGDECFFGYFGMQPWSRDGRRYLYHRWRAPHGRSVAICVKDAAAGGPVEVGESRAWNFQQGSLAQWLRAGDAEAVLFNEVAERRLGCRIILPGGRERRLDWPVQALHPAGTEAVSLNYRRLALIRPEYGYDVEVENFSPGQPPDRDGLWRVDLAAGEARLIVTLRDLMDFAPRPEMADSRHKVNHVVYSPGGDRFVFMHRWLGPRGKFSRLYSAAADGSDLRLLLDHRVVSHYAWQDGRTLLVWGRTAAGDGYFLLDALGEGGDPVRVEALDGHGDGHPSFSPDRRWIVTDTYPDRSRMRRLLLCRRGTREALEVGAFHAPWRYDGPVRCDLHPRWSPDGRRISIDSAHEGSRATYVVDVGAVVASSASN